MLFFDHLSRLVGGDRCGAADLADVFDHANLHRRDLQLFADFFAELVLAATIHSGQFGFG